MLLVIIFDGRVSHQVHEYVGLTGGVGGVFQFMLSSNRLGASHGKNW